MVRVHVKRHQGIIQEVEIKDHAGYADAGQDLVCAGVSSIAVGMMNALDEMVPEACDFVLKEAYIKIETILPDATAGILLQGMYYQLSTMQESYADYITINDQVVFLLILYYIFSCSQPNRVLVLQTTAVTPNPNVLEQNWLMDSSAMQEVSFTASVVRKFTREQTLEKVEMTRYSQK